MCVCGTDKSSCISITYFHYDRTHKVLGSLQTNGEKQFLPKQHERSVVKVTLYCLKVRKYQKLGCQYNLNSTLLCIFITIQSLITWSHTLLLYFLSLGPLLHLKYQMSWIRQLLNVYIYLLQHPAVKVSVSILHYWPGKLTPLYLELQRQEKTAGTWPGKVKSTPYFPKCTGGKEVQNKTADEWNTPAYWQEAKGTKQQQDKLCQFLWCSPLFCHITESWLSLIP